MGKQLFKGLMQVISEPNMKFEPGFVYFVREDDTKEHGFIYFNGKKYGTTKEVADKLKEVADKLATLEGVDVEERLKNLEDVSAETRISSLERVSASAETRISNLESASESAGNRITNIENDYLKREDKTALENSIAEVRTTANAADALSKENKSRLDSIGLSVVDGKLCVTFNQ